MAQPQSSAAPSLLALTAPPPRKPTATPEPGFDEQLTAATGAPSREAPPSDDVEEPAARDDARTAGGAESHRDGPADEPNTAASPDTEESAEAPTAEASLVAVLPATETIVAETHPDAVLPDEASTAIDVGLSPEALAAIDTNNRTSLTPTAPDTEFQTKTGATLIDPDAANQDPTPPVDAPAESTQVGPAPSKGLAEVEGAAGSDDGPSQSGGEVAVQAGADIEPAIEPRQKAGADIATEAPDASIERTSTAISETPDETSRQAPVETNSPPPAASASAAIAAQGPTREEPKASADTTTAQPVDAEAPPVADATRADGRERFAEAFRAAGSERTTTVDPTRFVSRVARAIDFAQQRGGGPIEIRLSPPELGSLRVQIELKEGVLTASLEAETPAARSTLLDNLPALRDRLEQQQIRIEKFDVDVRDDSRGDQPEGRQQEDRHDPERPRDERGARSTTGDGREPPAAETRRPATIQFGSDEINFVA